MNRITGWWWGTLLLLGLGAASSGAQEELREPSRDDAGYAYAPAGRRDPFLRGGASAQKPATCNASGLGGLRIQELALRGVVYDRRGTVALLVAPDQRTHFAKVGDRLCDGRIAVIEAASVRFLQEIDDPLASTTTREVVQVLHP